MAKSFYSWLLQFKNDYTAVGDFARDVSEDNEFPKHSISYNHLKTHLETKRAGDAAMNVFMEAFAEYKDACLNRDRSLVTQ